jgi:hypothetical protein
VEVMMRWKIRVATGLAFLAIASLSFADDRKPAGWQFEIMPYAWIPGTAGTLEVKEETASIDVTVGDILDLLGDGNAFAIGSYFGARYDRYSAFVDAFGGFIDMPGDLSIPTSSGTQQVSGTVKVRPVILDVAIGYQLGEWSLPERKRPLSLEMFLGARYTYLGTELEVPTGLVGSGGVIEVQDSGGSVSKGLNLVAPMGGVRSEVPLLDALTFNFRGDVGGSTALTWELVGELRYWLPWEPGVAKTWLDAGYRAVSLKQDFGDGNSVDLQFRGPILGLGFAF